MRRLVDVVADVLGAHNGNVEISKLLNELNKDGGSCPHGSGHAAERERLDLCVRCNPDRLEQRGSEVGLS